MKTILYSFGKIISYLFIKKYFSYFYRASRYVITGYLTKNLKYFGKNSSLKKEVILIGEEFISVGNYTSIGERTIISAWKREEHDPELIIGNHVCIGNDCHITASYKIIIGNNVLFCGKITITDNSHGELTQEDSELHPSQRKLKSKGPVIIGDRVWIGDKATILPNVVIGDAAIIGANAVVTRDVPPRSVAVGNPAKVIKQL